MPNRKLNTCYPPGAEPKTSSSGAVANASAVATIAKAGDSDGSRVAHITGFQVTGLGATAGAGVTVTVAGVKGGTLSYAYAAVAGAALINQPLIVAFDPPLPAADHDTDIVVTCPALGTGNTKNTVNAQGFVA